MTTFKDLGVSDELLQALSKQGIDTPVDIQIKSYPILTSKKDAWLCSPTGSGKTLAYLLPLIAQLDLAANDLQMMVLAPTHELAVQIFECLQLLTRDTTSALRAQLLIGNTSVPRQIEKLKKKPHVIVGSSGRVLELAKSKKLKLHKCMTVVIDEADNMMSDDGIGRVKHIIKMTPGNRHLVFASATDKNNSFTLAQEMGRDVQWIDAETNHADSKIEHYYIVEEVFIHKTDTLRKLLHALKPEKAIVFLHKNENVELVQAKLENKDLDIICIHAELAKLERQKILSDFRNGNVKILLSSDVSARGLDISGVTHIINMDPPSSSEDYVHRSGRTGRMGAVGVSITIVAANENRLIKRYEKDLGISIAPAYLKNGKFILEKLD